MCFVCSFDTWSDVTSIYVQGLFCYIYENNNDNSDKNDNTECTDNNYTNCYNDDNDGNDKTSYNYYSDKNKN